MTIGWAMLIGAVGVLVFQMVWKDLVKADKRNA